MDNRRPTKRTKPNNDPPTDERTVLLHFYHELQGPTSWSNTWDISETNIAQWYGIHCNTSGNVVSIDLSSNNLAGGDLTQATQHFLHLTHLTDLFLQHNQIHGTLPTALVHHPTLVRLDLSHNQLQGHVPSEYVTAEQSIAYEDEDEAAQEMDLSTETNIYDLIVALRSKTPHVYDTAQVYFPHNTTPPASPSSPSSRHTALHHHPFFSATNGAQEDQPQRFLQQYLLHREWEPATASATKPASTTTTPK